MRCHSTASLNLPQFGLRHRHRLGESGRPLVLQQLHHNRVCTRTVANPVVGCGREQARQRVRESELLGEGLHVALETIARVLIAAELHQAHRVSEARLRDRGVDAQDLGVVRQATPQRAHSAAVRWPG